MQLTIKLDLSKYREDEIVQLFMDNVISRDEFEAWREGNDKPITFTIN